MLLGTILVGVGTLGVLNVMTSEPYVMLAPPKEYIPNFTLKQYVGEHQSIAGKTLAFLTYPSAKYGRYSHNKRVE